MHLAIDAPALVITLNDQISRLTIYPRRSESHLETLIRLNAVGIAASELLIHNTDPTWIWLGDLDTAKTVAANVLEHLRASFPSSTPCSRSAMTQAKRRLE
ncbi:MAG: hypothetical protein IPO08_24135 [Xanthomonadales bacterium]|nr:hypothetical protein [Xanthomonadales bacterium]